MASEVDICNAALAHLGDVATVASINPPDSTAQSRHCARFYPLARDALLERHNWGFAMRRSTLQLLDITPQSWLFAYAPPPGVLNYLAVVDAAANDDLTAPLMAYPIPQQGIYTPQAFVVESLGTGLPVVYTNQVNAVLRHTVQVTDPSQFSPLFIDALALSLASYLAGPLLKGAEGRQVAGQLRAEAKAAFTAAATSDASQRHVQMLTSVPWMAGR